MKGSAGRSSVKNGFMSFVLLTLVSVNSLATANIDDDVDQGDGTMGSKFPHIPEPMVFDLVRPLGAAAGELEINTLAKYNTKTNSVEWAPEIEYAILDGLAVELELPFNNTTLEEYKFVIQGTLPDHTLHFAHGWQMIGRYSRHGSGYSSDMLYIAGYRLNARWSTLNMLGIRGEEISKKPNLEGLANFNLFYTLNENMVFGIESNTVFTGSRLDYLVTPQIHTNFTGSLSLQVGVGYRRFQSDSNRVVAISRLIFTF